MNRFTGVFRKLVVLMSSAACVALLTTAAHAQLVDDGSVVSPNHCHGNFCCTGSTANGTWVCEFEV